jgi:cytochrome c biogenesis protein CcmG/thiol:disulfide interchange protein DsbE
MRRILVPGLIAIIAVGVLALLIFGVARTTTSNSLVAQLQKGIHPVAPAADLAMPVLDGKGREDLANLRGKVVVVNLFASWCDPCAAEAPVLEQVQKQIAGRNATIVGVTYLDAAPDSEQFVKAHGITYPVLRDVSSAFTQDWETTGVPETYIINRQGRVVAIRRYQVTRSWLESTLAPLLAQPA